MYFLLFRSRRKRRVQVRSRRSTNIRNEVLQIALVKRGKQYRSFISVRVYVGKVS
jgi:hypothetical protein